MNRFKDRLSPANIAEIIESRSPAGRSDSVQGWHNLLKNLLGQMAPYLLILVDVLTSLCNP